MSSAELFEYIRLAKTLLDSLGNWDDLEAFESHLETTDSDDVIANEDVLADNDNAHDVAVVAVAVVAVAVVAAVASQRVNVRCCCCHAARCAILRIYRAEKSVPAWTLSLLPLSLAAAAALRLVLYHSCCVSV